MDMVVPTFDVNAGASSSYYTFKAEFFKKNKCFHKGLLTVKSKRRTRIGSTRALRGKTCQVDHRDWHSKRPVLNSALISLNDSERSLV